jgi:hypothetical protein
MASYKEEELSEVCCICKKELGDHFSKINGTKEQHHCPKEDGSKNTNVSARTYFKSASCN